MSVKKKAKTAPRGEFRVEFPRSDMWNPVRELMQFPAVVDNEPVLCTITYDALVRRFGAPPGPDKYAALDTFKANRSSIETLVKSFIKKGGVNLDKELVIEPNKLAWKAAVVCFPDTPAARWDADREAVSFPALVGEKPIQCFIMYAALWSRYGAQEESTALDAFRDNRASIQCVASLLVDEGRVDADNVLLIKTGDALKELAGIWKNDPDADEMLREIYKRRGRPMTEDGQ